MEEALRVAQRAFESGEVPVGAVVVCDGKIVGRGGNRNIAEFDPRLMPKSLPCAKPVQTSVTIVWEIVSSLLQLSPALCVRARWCIHG